MLKYLKHTLSIALLFSAHHATAFFVENSAGSASARFSLTTNDELNITVENTSPTIIFSNTQSRDAQLTGVSRIQSTANQVSFQGNTGDSVLTNVTRIQSTANQVSFQGNTGDSALTNVNAIKSSNNTLGLRGNTGDTTLTGVTRVQSAANQVSFQGNTGDSVLTNVANPTQNNHAANKLYVDTSVPVGTVVSYYGSSAPAGWLFLNGGTFSRTTYPALFALIGSTTLPDLRNRFVKGAANQAAVGVSQNYATARPTTTPFGITSNGVHTHSIGNAGEYLLVGYDHLFIDSDPGNDIYSPRGGGPRELGDAGNHAHTITGGDTETRPKNVALHFMIKAK